MRGKPSSIFNVTPQNIKPSAPKKEFSVDDWFDDIKQQARDNLNNFWERARIEWSARFNLPKYDKFEKYSREELLCELWEHFYLENPEHLDLKGMFKKVDEDTGYTYYVTGDPLIDELERSFGKGVVPDLNEAFKDDSKAKLIWEEPVFEDEEGNKLSASGRLDNAPENKSGKFITRAGTQAHKTDFTSDDWLDEALKEDPVIKSMKEKLGV
jgi:hypothetical protein